MTMEEIADMIAESGIPIDNVIIDLYLRNKSLQNNQTIYDMDIADRHEGNIAVFDLGDDIILYMYPGIGSIYENYDTARFITAEESNAKKFKKLFDYALRNSSKFLNKSCKAA